MKADDVFGPLLIRILCKQLVQLYLRLHLLTSPLLFQITFFNDFPRERFFSLPTYKLIAFCKASLLNICNFEIPLPFQEIFFCNTFSSL
jgi:hypothetical protein